MIEIFALLRQDHQQLLRHLEQMQASSQSGQPLDKADLDVLRSLLVSHARAEGHVLYDALKRQQKTEPDAYLACEEHHVAERILGELEQISDSRVLTAKLHALRDVLERHIIEEENKIFKVAAENNPAAELEQMGDRLSDLKARIQTDILGGPLNS